MDIYRKIDQLRTTELQVIRKGLFSAGHILTDGQFYYGNLSCGGIFKREKYIETADGNYIIKTVGFFGRQTLIIDSDKGEEIGKITKSGWDNKTVIEMNTGFNTLLTRQGGIFSRLMSWTNDQHGNFIQIKSCYRYSRPFTITIDQNITKTTTPIALITMIGINLILIKQAQAAAAM